ncbi:MAG: hypothetical protein IH840_00775 [Candidatus Heimdallarchaeota archaeon]|nr:hypothetical protein [Candidatus Heimdallarchaeota archaeon]
MYHLWTNPIWPNIDDEIDRYNRDFWLIKKSAEILPEPGVYCKWCPYDCPENPRIIHLEQEIDSFEVNVVPNDPNINDFLSFQV